MIIKPANRSSLQGFRGFREIGIDLFGKTNLIWALMKHKVNMFMEQKHRQYQQRFSQALRVWTEYLPVSFIYVWNWHQPSFKESEIHWHSTGKVGGSSHLRLHPPAMHFPYKWPESFSLARLTKPFIYSFIHSSTLLSIYSTIGHLKKSHSHIYWGREQVNKDYGTVSRESSGRLRFLET